LKTTRAICIPCDRKYEPGLKVLLKSLKHHNDLAGIDVVVISADLPDRPWCKFHRPDVPRFEQIPNRAFDIAAFFFLASLELDYDRLLWMGADQLILGDIMPLLDDDRPPFAAIAEGTGTFRGHHERICTGMLVVQPKAFPDMYEQVMAIALEGVSYDGGDQGVMNEWLIRQDIQPHILPEFYDVSQRHYVGRPEWWVMNFSRFRSIHYAGHKPWECRQKDGPHGLWWEWHDR